MRRILLSAEQVQDGLSRLSPDWSFTGDVLTRTVEFGSFLIAVRFVDELAPIAERLDHHPDLRLSWRTVEVSLTTHSAAGVTEFDLELARELDAIIDRLTVVGQDG